MLWIITFRRKGKGPRGEDEVENNVLIHPSRHHLAKGQNVLHEYECRRKL